MTEIIRSVRFVAVVAALSLSVFACSNSSSTTTTETGAAHWTYSGDAGPDNWAGLDPQYEACGGDGGGQQSPIDFAGGFSAGASDVEFHYSATTGVVVDNGHTIKFTPDNGGSVNISGKEYPLAQFHCHAPSEHTVSSAAFPMECHLVHVASDGTIAVVGVFYEVGAANAVIDTVFGHISTEGGSGGATHQEGVDVPVTDTIDPINLLPLNRSYYRYAGSLTTPPCSEGLVWTVFDSSTTTSQSSVDTLHALYGGNARPVQPLGDRTVSHAN